MKKLRILCLHGYHGSARLLREQMKALASGLDHLAEFIHVDAPALAQGDFGWWHAVRDENSADVGNPGIRSEAAQYRGWAATRDLIISLFRKEGPFDGIFGFSQGAALAALLVGLRSPDGKPTSGKPLVFDFAIMVGAFLASDPALAALYESKASYDLPSIHIIGASDSIVPGAYSHAVSSQFNQPLVLAHEGGHIIAATPEIRKQVAAFLQEIILRRTEDNVAPRPAALARSIEIALWPGRIHPSMRLFFPKTAGSGSRPALLVFRGGGYSSPYGSGGGSAEWAAQHGMVGIEVEYGTRSTQEHYPANYADAARAVRLVRQRALEWGIDPARIGVMGYSAGGHLASLLSTRPDLWQQPEDSLAGHISARPDLVVLAYPLISFVEQYSRGAFAGSVKNFFGIPDISESRRRAFSNELHVDTRHPPVFIWTTQDDAVVPSAHTQLFADACRRANVPVTLKIYPHGPHGMGLAFNQANDVRQWTDSLLDWLVQRNFIPSQSAKRAQEAPHSDR